MSERPAPRDACEVRHSLLMREVVRRALGRQGEFPGHGHPYRLPGVVGLRYTVFSSLYFAAFSVLVTVG